MLYKYIAAALEVFAITFVMAESLSTSTDPPIPESSKEQCLKLNNITNVATKDLVDSLVACKGIKGEERANLTAEAEAIYVIYSGILLEDYKEVDKLMNGTEGADKISGCVKTATAKELPAADEKPRVSYSTRSLVFDFDRCILILNLRNCIEDIFYVNSSLTVKAKARKDIFMKTFDVMSSICEQTMIRDDRSNSQHWISSMSVMVGSVMIHLI